MRRTIQPRLARALLIIGPGNPDLIELPSLPWDSRPESSRTSLRDNSGPRGPEKSYRKLSSWESRSASGEVGFKQARHVPDRGRVDGPIFLAADGRRLARHGAARGGPRNCPARQGSPSMSTRRRSSVPLSPARWMPGCRCAMSRKPTRAPPCATTGPGPHWIATRPTSSLPTSPEQPGKTAP